MIGEEMYEAVVAAGMGQVVGEVPTCATPGTREKFETLETFAEVAVVETGRGTIGAIELIEVETAAEEEGEGVEEEDSTTVRAETSTGLEIPTEVTRPTVVLRRLNGRISHQHHRTMVELPSLPSRGKTSSVGTYQRDTGVVSVTHRKTGAFPHDKACRL